MKKIVNFISEVKKEAQKVTWAGRKESATSTLVVVVAIVIASVFFLAVDGLVYKVIDFLLSFRGF